MKDPGSKKAVGTKSIQTSRSGIFCKSNLIEGLDMNNAAVIFGICVRKKLFIRIRNRKFKNVPFKTDVSSRF